MSLNSLEDCQGSVYAFKVLAQQPVIRPAKVEKETRIARCLRRMDEDRDRKTERIINHGTGI